MQRRPKWREDDRDLKTIPTRSLRALVNGNQAYLAMNLNEWSAEKYERYVGELNPYVVELERREKSK